MDVDVPRPLISNVTRLPASLIISSYIKAFQRARSIDSPQLQHIVHPVNDLMKHEKDLRQV